MKTAAIYWSRRDFRLTDNPALHAALQAARKVKGEFCPVFVLEDYMCAGDPAAQFGYPQRIFLSKALPAYAKNFERFLLLRGKAVRKLVELCQIFRNEGYVVHVYVNEDVYPDFYAQVARLRNNGLEITVLPDQMTVDPKTATEAGKQYSVFTPFKKSVWSGFMQAPVLPKARLAGVSYVPSAILQNIAGAVSPNEEALRNEFSKARTFEVMGKQKHTFDIAEFAPKEVDVGDWYIDETGAQKRFAQFCERGLEKYGSMRDSLAADVSGTGTSRMSLALTWGLVSARYLRSHLQHHFDADFVNFASAQIEKFKGPSTYLSELIWREFYKYLFFHMPSLTSMEFQERYRGTVEWVEEKEALKRFNAWLTGETGYPIVDAAMKQIASVGWMHNRSRMIVASVLTKNLGVDWRWGQEYFRAQLLDLDEASNNGGWQWGASVGADPKPIRIFNPYLQAEKYDPDTEYQRHWLGMSYDFENTRPIIEHKDARRDALERYGLGFSRFGVSRKRGEVHRLFEI